MKNIFTIKRERLLTIASAIAIVALFSGATVFATTTISTNIVTEGDLQVDGNSTIGSAVSDSVTANAYFTQLRIGTGATFDAIGAVGADELGVEGNAEIDGTLRVDGLVSATAGADLGSSTTGVHVYEETEAVTGAKSAAATETGEVYYIATAPVITLPAVADGLVFTFVVSGDVTSDATITPATADVIEGSIDAAGAAPIDCDAADVLTIEADNDNLGDIYVFRSNGTKWFVTGQTKTAASAACSG